MGNNIILTGMPGVGKSTVGVILAKELGYSFVDSDLLIQEKYNCLLKYLIRRKGVDGFIAAEAEVNASIDTDRSVIATGGSAVYSEDGMRHLKNAGTVIYLRLSFEPLQKRLGNLRNRGVILREGQTLQELYEERKILYEKYADIIIDEDGKDIEGTVSAIIDAIKFQISVENGMKS